MQNIRRSFVLAALWISLLLVGFAALPISAQEPGSTAPPMESESSVTLILEGNDRPPIPIALPAMRFAPGMDTARLAAAKELETTLANDLEASKVFRIQTAEDLRGVQVTGDRNREFEQYRALGNEHVVLGELRQEGDRIVFDGRVYELSSGQSILGKRYRGTRDAARRIAHTFADEILLHFTGRRGIALTRLAFHSDRTGDKEIFLMDYDGANTIQFSAHRSVSLFPVWTHDGGELAYVSYLNGQPGLYLGNVETRKKKPLVTTGRYNTSATFSPDGKSMIYSSAVEGNTDLFMAKANGTDARRLTYSKAIDTNAAWSPKGTDIAFTSARGGTPQIWVMDREGTNARRVSTDGDYNDGATWHESGTIVAYASRRSGVFQIAVTDTVTLETRVLTSGSDNKEAPSFSPDGRWIAYARKGRGRSVSSQIWVVSTDGRFERQLTSEGNNFSPDWSPAPR